MTRLSKRSFVQLAGIGTLAAVGALAGCSKEEKTTTTTAPAGTTTTTTTTTSTPGVGADAGRQRPAEDRLRLRRPGRRRRLDLRARQRPQGGREGVRRQGRQTRFVEKVPEAADAERVFRDMAGQGNKLIFGTTFGYMEPMLKVAADMKDVKFEHATGYKTADNMRTYDSRTYEGAYMAGVIAGAMTKTNTLGVVGSIPIPEVIRNINSFTLGAQSVNPKVKTKVVWVNEWFNPPKETEAAQSLLNGGADVLFQNTDSSAVLQTAEQGRQVRLRLGQRHDRLRARRRTWPRRSSTGRRTTSRPRATRSTAPGRAAASIVVGRQGRRDRHRLDLRQGAGRHQGQGRRRSRPA